MLTQALLDLKIVGENIEARDLEIFTGPSTAAL
jgi:hypothetical protein